MYRLYKIRSSRLEYSPHHGRKKQSDDTPFFLRSEQSDAATTAPLPPVRCKESDFLPGDERGRASLLSSRCREENPDLTSQQHYTPYLQSTAWTAHREPFRTSCRLVDDYRILSTRRKERLPALPATGRWLFTLGYDAGGADSLCYQKRYTDGAAKIGHKKAAPKGTA